MIVVLLIGAAVTGLGIAAWTGRWRRWAAWDGPPAYNGPISLLPGIGIALISGALAYDGYGQPVTDAVAVISWVGGLVLYLWRPGWYGPRWYRERRERGEVRLDLAISANVLADVIEGAPAQKAGWWSRWGRGRVAGWWRARLLDGTREVRGTLVLYRTALAFSALDGPNEILVLRSGDLRAAHADDGMLVLGLADGNELRFRTRSARRAARRVERTLMP